MKKVKLWKYSGIILVATGVLHTIVALLVGKDAFLGMLRDGFINSIGDNTDRDLAFWFLACGIFFIFFGHALHCYIKKTKEPAPPIFGYYLLAFSILGCFIAPVSGFWLILPQALIIIFAKRK
jgi:hypothetical protein